MHFSQIGYPAVYVFDCSGAGTLLPHFTAQQNTDTPREGTQFPPGSPTNGASNRTPHASDGAHDASGAAAPVRTALPHYMSNT